MQNIRRKTGLFFLLSMFAFFLAACGGGGGDSAPPDLSPAATTTAGTSVTNTSAVLNAIVNPKGLVTTAWFEYSKDPGMAANVIATTPQSLGSGSADNLVTQSITVLDQGTTYYFRVKANNSAGTKVGQIITFQTLPLPTATTNPATSKTSSGATLNAIVNPNGRATNAWFEYGTTTSFGSILDNVSRGSGTDNVTISAALTGLLPATQYFYRIVAVNSVGTSVGSTLNFTTAGGVPSVGTKAHTLLTATGATLNGDVNPNGLATNAWFEFGTTTSFGSILDNTSRGSGTDNVAMSAAIPAQLPGTTIYYRVKAINSVGPSIPGDTFSFTTLNPLPVANAGDNQAVFQGRTVTLDGSGSSDGFGGTLTYLWTQTAGPSVTLSSSTSASPTFTAPQVAYPSALLTFRLAVTSSRGPTATDNVNVTVKWGYFDDFSTDTHLTYSAYETLGSGSTFGYDPDAEAAIVATGVNKALSFYLQFPIDAGNLSDVGVFSLDFIPMPDYGSGIGEVITIRLGETFPPPGAAYYEISTSGTVKKIHTSGTETNSFAPSFDPYNVNTIKIKFSQALTTFEVNGITVATLNVLDTSIDALSFTVETKNQNAYYDNIKLEAAP